VPEFIDPVFTKTSPKRSFSLNRKRALWLVFAKTGSIISGTGIYNQQEGYQQQQKQRGYMNYSRDTSNSRINGDIRTTVYSRDTSNCRNNGDIQPKAGTPATAKTMGIYDLK
jgi:hypothetical protein